MLLKFFCWKLLLIPLIYCSNSTDSKTKQYLNKISSSETSEFNKTNVLTLPSEGGSIVTSASTLTLPKENHKILTSLDKELSSAKERPVVPRKGVKYIPMEDEYVSNSSDAKKLSKSSMENSSTMPISYLSHTIFNGSANNVTVNAAEKNVSNLSKRPHKPLVLVDEALLKIDHHNDQAVPSSNTLIHEQISKPDINQRIQIGNGKNPGMIMPIVITILTVPLFAVLGYMALRRGKEAWKNRHYKRMDFLLDGMYNE